MKRTLNLFVVIILTIPSGLALAQNRTDCTCRYQGLDFRLGEEVCLNGPNGPTMARCEMLLNNTSWKFTDSPCPHAFFNGQLTNSEFAYIDNLQNPPIRTGQGTTLHE